MSNTPNINLSQNKEAYPLHSKLPFVIILLVLSLVLLYNMNSPAEAIRETIPSAQLYEIPKAGLYTAEYIPDYASPSYTIADLNSLSQLSRYIYATDKKTGMTEEMFNIPLLLSKDVTVKKDMSQPKVLIFHTHGHEMFADSKDTSDGIIGAGNKLADILENQYGVKVLHITEFFDVENGKLQRDGAYERMEVYISKVLEANPTIELVIDLHRDGVSEGVHLVKNINGKPYAKFMFFNGLCKKWDNGVLKDTAGLSNPYIEDNLALSLKMQLAADSAYPGLARKIYLNAYRYSLHFKPKSMLIELGAQTNTKEEILNSVDVLAEIINTVILR